MPAIPQSDEPKVKIFISYSRKDIAFADRLEAALNARGFEPLIDRTEIYAFEDWWKRIEALIGRADTIVFVLSPGAVASEVALKEVAHAASLNKRLAPIVFKRVEDGAVPEALRRLNFIFFDDLARFEASADQLAEALQTDIGWIRKHTDYGEAARNWAATGRPSGFLLRSPALEAAERWIALRPHNAPPPTEETQVFIAESRRGATRRRNVLTGSLAAGLVVAVVLAGVAYWQRSIAVEQKSVALEQRDVAERRRTATIAELGTTERLRGNWDTALRLGVHAARLALALGQGGAEMPAPRTALAVAVWQSKRLLSLSGHEGPVLSAAFSPDGTRIVTTSDDKTARVWDAATGREIVVLRRQEDSQNSAAFSPDGARIVTASLDKTARIWDAATTKEIALLRGHKGPVLSAAFSPDGARIVTASEDKTARTWDATTGKEIAVLRGHESSVHSAAFSPDGARIVTASEDKTARIWDTTTGREITVLRGQEHRVVTGALSLPVATLALVNGHYRRESSAAFSPDGMRIVTASGDKTARIWDAATAKEITHEGVDSAAFSPDGTRIVTASGDKTTRTWDAATGKEIEALPGHEDRVNSVAFSPNGTRIVTASEDDLETHDFTARILDTATGKEIAVLRGHEEQVNSAALSPDRTRIVTASNDGTARIWDAATGKEIAVLRGHEDWVIAAAFSPDGTRIVTASLDKTARIWDAATAKEIAVLRGHEDKVLSAEFSPDSTRIVTTSDDDTARIWDVHFATMLTKDLVVEVCTRQLRGLTTLSRDEMRLAGYSEDTPEFDVCAGIE